MADTAGRSGGAVGDRGIVCLRFLPVGVWFPGPINISCEVRRLQSQLVEDFDQPTRSKREFSQSGPSLSHQSF